MKKNVIEIMKDIESQLENDRYSDKITHCGKDTEDVVDAINELLFCNYYTKLVIEVEKELDEYHIKFRVIEKS